MEKTADLAPLSESEIAHSIELVATLRAQTGLSIPQLAQVLGYKATSGLYNLLNHRKPISRQKYVQLCECVSGGTAGGKVAELPAPMSAAGSRPLDPTKISLKEVGDARTMVTDLRQRGWTMQEIQQRLGYANASPLYALAAGNAGIARDKFEMLRQLHGSDELPPVRQRAERDRELYRLQIRAELEAELQEAHAGEMQALRAALAAANGAESAEATREPSSTRTPCPEEPRLESRSPVLGQPRSALEAFPQYTETLASLARRMEEHAKVLATPLTAHGWHHYAQKVLNLAEELGRAVG